MLCQATRETLDGGMPRDYSSYLFDLDGTLIDTVPLIIESYRFATERVLGVVYDDSAYRRLIGLKLPEACARLSDDPKLVQSVLDAYLEHNMAHHNARVRAFDGISSILAELRERHVQLAVVTSKRRAHALLGLEVCALSEYFPVVVAADDVRVGKPDPECVRRALHQLEAEPSEAMMVGDSVHDMEAGKRAGTATTFVTWGAGAMESLMGFQPDFVCESIPQLARLALRGGTETSSRRLR